MKTTRLVMLLWTVSLTVGAQNKNVEQAIRDFLSTPGLTTSESIIRERDLSQSGNPMKSMCEVWEFTCDANLASDIEHLSALMAANSSSERCYYVKTHTPGSTDWHDILVGDNPKHLVELGRSERCRYTIVNFIDTLDSTKSHRYAYALEWQEQNIPFKLKEEDGKLIKIPVTEKTLKGKKKDGLEKRASSGCSSTLHEIITVQVADYKDKSAIKRVLCSRFERTNPL